MSKLKHLGSNFDEFLKEEGILDESEAIAIKQALAYNSSLKSINNTDTDSKEIILMIVGGASVVTGALLLNSGPLMYLMIFGGIGLSILGLFMILVGFENL